MRFQDLPVPIQSFRLKPTGDIPYQKDGKPLPVKSIKAAKLFLAVSMFSQTGP